MAKQTLHGWGFQEIGWLLDQIAVAGGIVPSRYFRSGDNPSEWARARKARTELGQSISFAFTWEKVCKDAGSDSVAQKRLNLLVQVRGQLQRALHGLDRDPLLLQLLNPRIDVDPATGVGLHEIIVGMRRLDGALSAASKDFPEEGIAFGSTAQGVLFSRLATAYKAGLDSDPVEGIVKTHRNHSGPFIAFVRSAYSLAGKSMPSGAALTKAVQRHVLNQTPGQ